jgi:hypothetical protein
MFLTEDQKKIIKSSSSGLTPIQFNNLSKEESELYALRLEEGIKIAHAINPNAFLWRYNKDKPEAPKIDIESEIKKRKFFDAPTGEAKYVSAVKYRHRFSEAVKVSTGVK